MSLFPEWFTPMFKWRAAAIAIPFLGGSKKVKNKADVSVVA